MPRSPERHETPGRPLPGVAPAKDSARHLHPLGPDAGAGGEIQHALILLQQEIQNEDRKFRPRRHRPQPGNVAARLRQQRLDQFGIRGDMRKAHIGNIACLMSRHRISIFFPQVTAS